MVKEKDAAEKAETLSKKSFYKKIIVVIVGSIVLIALLGSSLYFYFQYQASQKLLKDPSQATKQDIASLIVKVSKLMSLPADEIPTVATVSDRSKLGNQEFFLKAENGDKVLIYTNARRAILYRPAINKIVDVTSVNVNQPTGSSAGSAAAQPIQVALFNGTSTNGLTTKVEAALRSFTAVKTDVALKANSQGDYTDSVVVDLTGKNKEAAAALAAFSKGKVASLPAGETKPEGIDILIILGTSYLGVVTPTPTP